MSITSAKSGRWLALKQRYGTARKHDRMRNSQQSNLSSCEGMAGGSAPLGLVDVLLELCVIVFQDISVFRERALFCQDVSICEC